MVPQDGNKNEYTLNLRVSCRFAYSAIRLRRNTKANPMSGWVFKAGEESIEYVHEYKYLGIHINEHLNWEESLSRIIIKAQRALAGLNSKTRKLGGFHFSTYSRLFEAL